MEDPQYNDIDLTICFGCKDYLEDIKRRNAKDFSENEDANDNNNEDSNSDNGSDLNQDDNNEDKEDDKDSLLDYRFESDLNQRKRQTLEKQLARMKELISNYKSTNKLFEVEGIAFKGQ